MPRFGLAAGLAAVFLGLATLASSVAAQDEVAIPALSARVTDLTGTLSAEQKASLDSRLAALDAAGGAQIAVLLIPTTQPETIEQFGIRLAEAWKIGHASGRSVADNGVIVIVAKDDRRARIEVGYGLEGAIPDAIAKRIIAEQMTPKFKQGDFAGGIKVTVDSLELASKGELPDEPATANARQGSKVDIEGYGMAVMAAAFVGGIIRKILGVFGLLLISGLVGGAALLFGASWLIAGLLGLATFILSFFNLGGISSGRGRGGGGFGGGFGGGGGFSGGGGGFGGGGASGSW
jgi:uncharacterized protein